MKTKLFVLVLVVTLFALLLSTSGALAQGPNPRAPRALMSTAFTYQGQLKSGGSPYTGTCLFEFRLYDAATVGTQIGTTQTVPGVSVTNGLFTTQIDFGAGTFDGNARWLDISVLCGGLGVPTPLTPRQPLTPAPYALALPGLWTQQHATSPNLIGGYSGNSVTSGVYGATIGGGGDGTYSNRVTDNYGTVGGGRNNRAGDDAGATNGVPYATVGGGQSNTASGQHATVGGGVVNTASSNDTTISGGNNNTASGSIATIGGGLDNTASGTGATIGGGTANNAGYYAAIGGGYSHTASGANAAIGGGYVNAASGNYATVPGGTYASASHYGEMAYASGRFAAAGDAQTSTYVLRRTTANATPTELFLDGSGARITLATVRAMAFDILIIGRSQTAGNTGGYQIRGVIERTSGGTTQFVSVPTVTTLGEDDASWNVAVEADNTNDALVIKVTGSAIETVRWVAAVRTVEVAW